MGVQNWKKNVCVATAGAVAMLMASAAQAEDDKVIMAPGADGAEEQVMVVLPEDEETLRALEVKHRRIINTAQRQCTTSLGGINRNDRDPCVISGVETGVEISDDPVLKAFHEALPMSVRYDGDRPTSVWRIGQDDDTADVIVVEE